MSAEMQTCYRCNQERPLTDFILKKNNHRYDMCSPCLSEILKGSVARPKKERLSHTATERTCYLCRQRKPNRDFTRRSNGTYFSACKACNINVFAHRRRARLLQVGGTFTTAEWLEVLARHPVCPRCKRAWEEIAVPPHLKSAITRDHVVPISKGGSNSIDNIQPLCYSCNSIKGPR